jgi:TonB family protein
MRVRSLFGRLAPMRTNLFTVVCALVVLTATTIPVLADTKSEIEKRLQQDFSGTNVFLRSSLLGDRLQFDAEGHSKSAETGPWTVAAVIAIHDIHCTDSTIEIEGERIFLAYDDKAKKFRSVFPIPALQKGIEVLPADPKEAKKAEKKKFAKRNRVHITILRPAETTQQAVLDTVARVLLPSNELVSNAVPLYWRRFTRSLEGSREEDVATPSGGPVSRVGKGISPPKAVHSPDPEYPESARELRFQGVVVLSCIVTKEGEASDLEIVRPAGLGLDEKAVETVRTWRFNPAMKNGDPVAVKISIEVAFHLY